MMSLFWGFSREGKHQISRSILEKCALSWTATSHIPVAYQEPPRWVTQKRSAQDKGMEINSVCGRFEPIPKQETSKDVYNIDIGQNTHTTTKKSKKLCSSLEKQGSTPYLIALSVAPLDLSWPGLVQYQNWFFGHFFPRKVKFCVIYFVLEVSILCRVSICTDVKTFRDLRAEK